MLDRFPALKVIYLEGHHKNIEVLSRLHTLEDVTLRSISTPDLTYLRPLHRMWSLDIKLGGITELGAISGLSNIKYLELWQVRGLSCLDVLADLPGLQNLFMQSLPRVTALPSLASCRSLRRVTIESMKGLMDFEAIAAAPLLTQFQLVDGASQQPDQLMPLLQCRHLKEISCGFGSDKKNNAFDRLRAQHGKAGVSNASFAYR